MTAALAGCDAQPGVTGPIQDDGHSQATKKQRNHVDDETFVPTDDELMDTRGRPKANTCAGCGSTAGLHALTAAISAPQGHDIGCATLCLDYDGRSFLHLLDPNGLERAFARHAHHAAAPRRPQQLLSMAPRLRRN